MNVEAVIVVGSSDLEKVARGFTAAPMSEAPSAGTTDVTCGRTGSATVKLQVTGAPRAFPSSARMELASDAV